MPRIKTTAIKKRRRGGGKDAENEGKEPPTVQNMQLDMVKAMIVLVDAGIQKLEVLLRQIHSHTELYAEVKVGMVKGCDHVRSFALATANLAKMTGEQENNRVKAAGFQGLEGTLSDLLQRLDEFDPELRQACAQLVRRTAVMEALDKCFSERCEEVIVMWSGVLDELKGIGYNNEVAKT